MLFRKWTPGHNPRFKSIYIIEYQLSCILQYGIRKYTYIRIIRLYCYYVNCVVYDIVCACVCVCARARVCVCVHVRVCVCVCERFHRQ